MKLTKRQHVLARRSIARFVGDDGRVDVWFRKSREIQRCPPEHSVFWTHRAWDQPSERRTKTQIEDRFQTLADAILRGKNQLGAEEHAVVTRFQQLWALRFGVKEFAPPEVELPRVAPSEQNLTQGQRENLELSGYSFATGSRILGPQLGGLLIWAGLLRAARGQAARTEWSVVTSGELEFLIPDSFHTIPTVPLSPNSCLMAIPGGARELSPQETMHINNMAARQCVRHAFARDFVKTGVAFDTPPTAAVQAGG